MARNGTVVCGDWLARSVVAVLANPLEPLALRQALRKEVILSRGLGEQADGRSKRPKGYHQWLKRQKHRLERHRANRNPECVPSYGKYRGYET